MKTLALFLRLRQVKSRARNVVVKMPRQPVRAVGSPVVPRHSRLPERFDTLEQLLNGASNQQMETSGLFVAVQCSPDARPKHLSDLNMHATPPAPPCSRIGLGLNLGLGCSRSHPSFTPLSVVSVVTSGTLFRFLGHLLVCMVSCAQSRLLPFGLGCVPLGRTTQAFASSVWTLICHPFKLCQGLSQMAASASALVGFGRCGIHV